MNKIGNKFIDKNKFS